jgi:hypothetical protein
MVLCRIMQTAMIYASSARMKTSTWPGLLPGGLSFFGRGLMTLIAAASSCVFKWAAEYFSIVPYACPTVLRDLIDVCAFEQAQANVCVAQAIGCSRPTVAVCPELFFIKNCVE